MLNWLWQRLGPNQHTSPRLRRPRTHPKKSRPLLEILEDRLAPAAFLVNSFLDTDAVNLSSGFDQAGNITLRSAIEAANHLGGSNSIQLLPGTYSLVSHFATSGPLNDLTIANNLTITGGGSNVTSIDAGGLGRVLQVGASANVQISGVWIANGYAVDEGAAILNAGNLTLSDDLLNFNRVAAGPSQDARGGSVFNASGATLTITNNTQVMNSSAVGGAGTAGVDGTAGAVAGAAGQAGTAGGNGGQGLGGAIYNDGGSVSISASTFANNVATGGAAGKGARVEQGSAMPAPPSRHLERAAPAATVAAAGPDSEAAFTATAGQYSLSIVRLRATLKGAPAAPGAMVAAVAPRAMRQAMGQVVAAPAAGAPAATRRAAVFTVWAPRPLRFKTRPTALFPEQRRGAAAAAAATAAPGALAAASAATAARGPTPALPVPVVQARGQVSTTTTGSVNVLGGALQGTAVGGTGGAGGNGGAGGSATSNVGTTGNGGSGGNGTERRTLRQRRRWRTLQQHWHGHDHRERHLRPGRPRIFGERQGWQRR